MTSVLGGGVSGRAGLAAAIGIVLGILPLQAQITEYSVAFNGLSGIAAGPDGAMWFTGNRNIGRITTSGTVTSYTIPTPNATSYGIAAGSDGAMWFTESPINSGNVVAKIGRIAMDGSITEYPLADPNSIPQAITAGPDGALWFIEAGNEKIGRITTSGAITEFTLPASEINYGVYSIVAGPDGALWLTEEYGADKIARMTTSGTFTIYPVMQFANSGSISITVGPDNAMWFADSNGKVGRITTSGSITEYPVPGTNNSPIAIASGPDGALWFTDMLGKIGRITTSGTVTSEVATPTPSAGGFLGFIAAGPDGAMWFTEIGGKIGRIPAPGASGAPTITMLQNNYSFILPWLPNYGIAQGSIFVMIGSGMSSNATPELQSSQGGLPKSLNGTSLSVTVNGTTTTPSLYYTSAAAVAAVLPSNTPVGTGTLTLTFNGQSTSTPIQVVQSALGLDTLYGIGTGVGIVEDAGFNVFGYSNPAKPNQTVILWGSGVGPDTGNDDRTFPQNINNLTNVPLTVYVGGVSATVAYRGRSQYPGLDQMVITIPQNAPLGCFVPIVAQQGSVVSNTITVAISADGGPCGDAALGYSAGTLTSLEGKTNGNVGVVIASQSTDTSGIVTNAAAANFEKIPGGQYGSGLGLVSQGACVVVPPAPGAGVFPFTGLNAGTVSATPSTGKVTLSAVTTGLYAAALPAAAITGTGGTVTFQGTGADVGAFSTSVSLQAPLTWTNKAALANVTLAQGATVTWSGGFPNSTVEVIGSSAVTVNGVAQTVSFYCQAPVGAGQVVIPAAVTLALPAGAGTLKVVNNTTPQTFSAAGLDYGYSMGSETFSAAVNYR